MIYAHPSEELISEVVHPSHTFPSSPVEQLPAVSIRDFEFLKSTEYRILGGAR